MILPLLFLSLWLGWLGTLHLPRPLPIEGGVCRQAERIGDEVVLHYVPCEQVKKK